MIDIWKWRLLGRSWPSLLYRTQAQAVLRDSLERKQSADVGLQAMRMASPCIEKFIREAVFLLQWLVWKSDSSNQLANSGNRYSSPAIKYPTSAG